MKKLSLLLVVLILLAGTHAYAENVKIGSIDLVKALNDSDAGKKAKTDLEFLIKSNRLLSTKKGKILRRQRTKSRSSLLCCQQMQENLRKRIWRGYCDYQRQVSDSQNEVKEKEEGELTGNILKELRDIIQKIGIEEGYTIILEGGEGQIPYAKKEIDLTQAVIKKHNELKAKPKK